MSDIRITRTTLSDGRELIYYDPPQRRNRRGSAENSGRRARPA